MVKALSFKGDKKPKKRKHADTADRDADGAGGSNEVKPEAGASRGDEDPENDDSWVSADSAVEVTGPIMLVLPTTPPSALACDANGKVFALPVENIVEGNPSTAEPHDVRQVWVANTISGTESFRFKGSHGKYVEALRRHSYRIPSPIGELAD
jgi:protein FRG1